MSDVTFASLSAYFGLLDAAITSYNLSKNSKAKEEFVITSTLGFGSFLIST